MEGLNGHLEARHVRAGDLARGSDRQTLVNENGQVEVTRLMALTELQRRGEATDVVQFMNGKIDTLFAGRGEIQSRRQAMSEELARRIQPSSPTSGQVTAVRGFADNLDVMLRDPRRMTAVEFMAELNNSERQRVVKTAALMAIAGGYDNLTPEQIKRAKVLAQGGRRIGPSRFNDPVIRPYLQAAIRQWGYQTTVRRNRQADIERSSTIVDNIIRSNPRLTRWVNAEVQAGRNTPQNPAISRRQMERLAGGRITPQQNSRQARYELARTIEAHARDRMSRFNEGQTVQATPARPQGEMMQRFESKPTIPLEEARSINSVATASSGPAVMSEQRFNELRAEAAAKGARPLELGKPRAVAEAEAAAATGKVERREAPIDAVLERLRAPSADRDVFPVREPAQVRDSDGNPMFGVPIANRLTLAVETLRDAFGATSVELDFAESPAGSLGESLFALGRSHGYSIIVSTGTRERLPEIIDFGNGVISVSSSVPIASARAVIARSGATLRWVSEQPQDFSPIGLLYSLANRGIGLRTLQSAWEAKTGQKYDTELFLEALAATANDRGLSAAVFESFMPLLDKRQRAMIMAAKPKEFADLYAKQLAALEAAGFESPRANASLLGPKKETELVLGVASGAIPYETSKGTVRASLLNAMNEGYERINTYFSTATEIAANIRVNREALIKAINELTGNEEPREGAKIKEMTPEEHHADMDRRIAEVSDAIEPIVLYERGKADIDKAKFIERMYPGIIQSALRNLKKKLTPKQSDPVTFEHLGKIVTVIPAKQKNGKNTIGSLIIEERDLVTATGRNAELKLTESERETVDMAREMLARGEERTEVPISELGGDKPPAPPKPPKEPTPEGGDMPEAGETRLSVSESEQRKTGLKGLFLRTVGKWMMDPNSLANLLGDKNLEKVIRDSYEIDQRIENQKQEQLDTVRRIVRELERDKSSTLINGKDGTELIKVLETEIEPTRAALDNHPMTAKLTEREKDFVIALKQIFEEHRQDHIAFLRDTVRVGYKAQSNMRAMADRANKFDKDLDVEVLRERGSGRKYFMVNDGRERVRMDREGFIDFMVNRQVPENYGYRFSYFPHMFFGSYRAKMSVVKDGKVVREIPFGVGEAGKREVERAEVMRQVEEKIEELRLIDPEYGFDIKMSAGGATAPSEAVYMPMALRRRLVRAIRNETGGITSEINDALMGKLTSKPVKTAFLASMLKREGAENYSTDVLRVAELAIAAHYRNKLSREIDKATRKTIEEMEGGGSERWVTDYAIGTLHHGVYGNKNGIIADTLGNSYSGFGAKTMGALRTVQFYRQLARPAQHVINSTQATQVWALIGTKGFAQAVKFYNSPEGQKFLKDYGFFDTNGRFDPGKFGDALGPRSMNAMNGIHRVLNKFTGKFWDANSEARNQNFAFAALAHHAMTKMNMSPQEAATYGRLWGSLFTQYRFSRFNDPLLLRGDFARTAGQFKRFFIQSMGLLGTLARHAKNGDVVEGLPRFSPFARFMLLNTLLGGFRGSLIGATGILAGSLGSGIYSAIRQTTDDEYLPGLPEKPFASQEEAFAWLKKNVGEGAAEYIMFGAFNAAGIDASGNFNLMNFGFGGPLEWLAGPSLGMFKRTYSDVFDQTDAMGRPVHTRAFESLIDSGQTTKSFRSLVELIYFLNSFDESTPERVDTFLGILSPNKYRSGGGELVRFRSLRETVLNAAGFRTTDESAEVLQNNLTVLWQDQFSQVKRRVAGVYTTDPQRALRMMADWNRRYGAFLPMNFMDISSQVENQIQRQTTSRGLRTLNRRVNDAVQNALGQQQ
jgi:hypothetical protein